MIKFDVVPALLFDLRYGYSYLLKIILEIAAVVVAVVVVITKSEYYTYC